MSNQFLRFNKANVYAKFPASGGNAWVLIRENFTDFSLEGERESEEAEIWGPGSDFETTLADWSANIKIERIVEDMSDFLRWYDEADSNDPTPFLVELDPANISQAAPVMRFEVQINKAPSMTEGGDKRRFKNNIDNKITAAGMRLFETDIRTSGDESTPFKTLFISA